MRTLGLTRPSATGRFALMPSRAQRTIEQEVKVALLTFVFADPGFLCMTSQLEHQRGS